MNDRTARGRRPEARGGSSKLFPRILRTRRRRQRGWIRRERRRKEIRRVSPTVAYANVFPRKFLSIHRLRGIIDVADVRSRVHGDTCARARFRWHINARITKVERKGRGEEVVRGRRFPFRPFELIFLPLRNSSGLLL